MSTKSDYSADEWRAITGAPVAAGLLVTLADASGPVGIAKEALAVGRAISRSASGDVPPIVKSLAESVKSDGGRPEMPDLPKGDRDALRTALIGVLRSAVHTVETKSPGEVAGYKAWLATVAAEVSSASKEGGFLGFGGTLVSPAEEAALKQLADVLGTPSLTLHKAGR